MEIRKEYKGRKKSALFTFEFTCTGAGRHSLRGSCWIALETHTPNQQDREVKDRLILIVFPLDSQKFKAIGNVTAVP